MTGYHTSRIVTNMNVREYFRDSVCTAVANQQLDASESTIFYLVNLLTTFTRSEDFFDKTENGMMLRPLALIYADALHAETDNERNRCLQRLGDVALFISGLFSSYLNRKTVDLDYYISMGGNAYGSLAVTVKNREQGRIFSQIFDELAEKFVCFVNVFAEIGENNHANKELDIMRTYEIWLQTGNKNAERKLRETGIQPVMVSNCRQ